MDLKQRTLVFRCDFFIIKYITFFINMSTRLLYFKRKNNSCYTINIKPELSYNNIVSILAKKESILLNNLLLIHKGKQVQNIEDLMKLGSKSIVHLVDLQQVKNERICINLRDMHNNQSTKIIDSSTKIGNFVRQNLIKLDETPSFHIGLFYLGKVLNSQKNFAEQLVEHNSQLFVINLKDYAKRAKPITQLNKAIVLDQSQSQEMQPLAKINHRILSKQPEEVELKSTPIDIQNIKCQQLKEEKKNQLEQKIQQEQKQQELSDILLKGFKQAPSEEQKQHENKKTQEENLYILNKEFNNHVRNQQNAALGSEQKQLKLQQPNPQQNYIKQQKYVRTQSLQSKQNEHNLQEIMEVSQLPEVTYYNFKIKISQVESHNSENEPQNNVEFDEEDSHSIQSSECHKVQQKDQVNQSEKTLNKQEIKSNQFIQPLQILGQRDILPGDLIFTGADYHNQTVSFIDNLLKQYKGMFE